MVTTYTHKYLDAARKEYTEDQIENMKVYRAYADGLHARMVTPGQRALIAGQAWHDTADNILRLVLLNGTSRLAFLGWEVSPQHVLDTAGQMVATGEAKNAAVKVQQFLADCFMRNQLSVLQYDTHWNLRRDGDAAISLTWRGRPRVARERWWNGEDGVFLLYDRNGDPEVWVKEWSELKPDGNGTTRRRTVYYADRFIRYQRSGNGWTPIRAPIVQTAPNETVPAVDSDGTVRWVKADGVTPLGLPLVHFANGRRDDTPYGLSDLTGLVGLQDDANSMQFDITLTSKFTGAQMLAISGAKSADGTTVTVGPGRVLEFSDPAADAHAIPAGDITPLTEAHSYKRGTIAINSQTPVHVISGANWPSGEAVVQADMPATDKANTGIINVAPRWTDTGHKLTEIANVYGSAGLDEDAPITSLMDDPRRIDEYTQVKIDHERARMWETVSRITDRTLLEASDLLTPQQIKALFAEREARADEMAMLPPVRIPNTTAEENDEDQMTGEV